MQVFVFVFLVRSRFINVRSMAHCQFEHHDSGFVRDDNIGTRCFVEYFIYRTECRWRRIHVVFDLWRCWNLSSLLLFPGWCCVEWYILSELWLMSSSKECGDFFAICWCCIMDSKDFQFASIWKDLRQLAIIGVEPCMQTAGWTEVVFECVLTKWLFPCSEFAL